jgi:ABC-type phosphate transport system auxiliary subunit
MLAGPLDAANPSEIAAELREVRQRQEALAEQLRAATGEEERARLIRGLDLSAHYLATLEGRLVNASSGPERRPSRNPLEYR